MQAVKITDLDEHSIVTGSDRAAVERAITELIAAGATLLESIKPLGNNWIGTVQRARETPAEWCEVTSIGLQLVIEGSSLAIVKERIEQLSTYGAALVAGPEQVEGKWVAVVDERATQTRSGDPRS